MGINFSARSTKLGAVGLAERLKDNRFQMLVLGTGQGKTAIATAAAGIIAHRMKRDINVFVVAPRAKLDEDSWQWTVDEYNRIAEYKLHISHQSTPQGIGIAKKNDKFLKRELKAMDPKKVAKMNFLKQWYAETLETPTVFIIDEAHMFKNPTAKQSNALQTLTASSIVIGLSATPMSNGLVEDGVNYLIMNGFYETQEDFRRTHIPPHCYDDYYRPDVRLENGDIDPNRFRELELFESRIEQTMFAPVLPVDFDMPDVSVETVTYQLSDATSMHMRKCHKDYRERRYDTYMRYLTDLREAIGRDVQHARELAKIILRDRPRQPLIFYSTNAELENIRFALEQIKMPYKMINGHGSKNKVHNVDKDDVNQAIIIQYKAGGAAIEFPNSDMSVFFGLQYSWQDTEQAFGRNVRRNMTHAVRHIFLLARNPHDEKVFHALEQKERFTEKYKEALAVELSVSE